MLFSAEETRSAVERFLLKGASGRAASAVERVEIEIIKGAVHGRAFSSNKPEAQVTTLGPSEMMSAILMFCAQRRIPLATRAMKQLENTPNGLMLSMSINADTAAPRIKGNAITYAAPLPPALIERTASVSD